MRGTLTHRPRVILQVGIIPAHAGNTWDARWRASWCWDHPPHMRGTHITNERPDRRVGIIPAHAGNTRAWRPCRPWPRDHPRACGEHGEVRAIRMTVQGSSPRMRGTLLYSGHHRLRTGIIPAHAGNTVSGIRYLDFSRDHPRACGEHPALCRVRHVETGSSPRMRGTHALVLVAFGERGIIPAHAGNTFTPFVNGFLDGDHPRACEEHKPAEKRSPS